VQLPFSHDAFLDVFGAYNQRWWPFELVLWVVTTVVATRWLTGPGVSGRLLMALLGVHWVWSGIAYHWTFFRAINPAAAVFAAAFVAQGALFVGLAMRAQWKAARPRGFRGLLATGLLVYSLVYPAIGLGLGLTYPRLPLFAVPCPSALLTAGVLLGSARVPRAVFAVPILWAVVGSSAAWLLGIYADLALAVAAMALVVDAAFPLALGPRANP
jgi:hypothetical protein